MNTKKVGAVILFALHSVLFDTVADQTRQFEETLKETIRQDISFQTLGRLYARRSDAPNIEIQGHVVRACAAGLLYLGQSDTYKAKIRDNVPNVTEFENSLLEKCTSCGGEGKLRQRCDNCNGDGVCRHSGCQGGLVYFRGFDGRPERRRCLMCNGTSRCKYCDGVGQIEKTCSKCKGFGGVFMRSIALTQCKKEMESAVNALDELNKFESEKLAKQEYESKMQAVELAAKKEAIIAEAKAQGEEKARQAALAEREMAEIERQKEKERKYAEIDKEYIKSIIVIEGDRGKGTGFLCEFKGKKRLVSNAHVLCGNRSIRLRTLDNTDLAFNKIFVCRDRDIVLYEVEERKDLVFLTVFDNVANMNNQEEVVVFGNSSGGGVVTTLRGKMQGIGPDRIEVDATFVKGNSGSPIIAYPYNSVVGMATYLTKEPEVDWDAKSTRFADVRRYGVRIDNLDWSTFFELDRKEYSKALDIFDEIEKFTGNELQNLKRQGRSYYASAPVKIEATKHLEAYKKTPKWMRQYSDDALLAAYFCAYITK